MIITGGQVLGTFTNPFGSSYQGFGWGIAAVGKNAILAGDYNHAETPDEQPGRAYLFDTNGLITTTFTNPNPSTIGMFGLKVARLSNP